MNDGKITDFSGRTKQEEWKKIPRLLNKWTISRKDNAFTENIKVGDTFTDDDGGVWVIIQMIGIRTRSTLPRIANFIIYTDVIAQNAGIYDYEVKKHEVDFWRQTKVKTAKNSDGIKGYEPVYKIGDLINLSYGDYRTLGRVSNIVDYKLNFGSYSYSYDIEEIQPWPFAEIRNAVKRERLNNVELEPSSEKVTKINFKN